MDNFKTPSKTSYIRFRAAKIIAIFMLIALLAAPMFLLSACDKDDAKLLFVDNFDGDAVDEAKWLISGTDHDPNAPGLIRRGGWWTRDSVFTSDGNLVIRTTYDYQKNTFYTGAVNARELMTYGYYEARCKLPEAYGMWAAFWIMCDKMTVPFDDVRETGTEIDIFESPFYRLGGSIQHALHTGGYGDMHQNNFTLPISLERAEGSFNGYETWHTFAVDWQPDGYKFYVDGELTWQTVDPYGSKNSENYIAQNVSDKPSYIILSVEVGGEGGVPGDPPFVFCGDPVRDNQSNYDMMDFHVDFLVDYVKVWDKYPYSA